VSRFHLRRVGLTGTRVCLTSCPSLAGRRKGVSGIHQTEGGMFATGGGLTTGWRENANGLSAAWCQCPTYPPQHRRLVKDRNPHPPIRQVCASGGCEVIALRLFASAADGVSRDPKYPS
jgi:hypothetical protein